jgi:hypothetical protein
MVKKGVAMKCFSRGAGEIDVLGEAAGFANLEVEDS